MDRELHKDHKNAYNDRQLIGRIQNTLKELFKTLPDAHKWDDIYDDEVIEMLETACSLRDEIDQLGYIGEDEELDVLNAYIDANCDVIGANSVAQDLRNLGASDDLLSTMGFDILQEEEYDDEPNFDDLEIGFNPYMGCYDFDC